MNKLAEGVAGRQIVKYFEENGGKVAVNAESVGSLDSKFWVYRITFEDGEVADYKWEWDSGLEFKVKSVEKMPTTGSLADDDGELITIQAKANVTDGHVTSVRLTGVSALLGETIHDIAQEAVNATYGQHKANHRRVVVFTDQEWVDMRETEPESITVRVHTY
ncbi:hypothetical protein SEA_ATUIN_311 [Arthrobacter phage Atuin]|nr:hypothetical protein SEA_ATUIN_110 [Arthrobacter phage Atuin]